MFSLYARLTNLDVAVQAGEYDLPRRVSPAGLLTHCNRSSCTAPDTAAEGAQLSQVLKALRTNEFLSTIGIGFINSDLDAVLGRLNLSAPLLKAIFSCLLGGKGTKVSDVLMLAHKAMMTKLSTAWQQRSALTQLATLQNY